MKNSWAVNLSAQSQLFNNRIYFTIHLIASDNQLNIGMNKYCNKINLPFEPLTADYDIFSQREPLISVDLKYLNPELKNFLNELNVKVTFMECFYRKPHGSSGIHVDDFEGDFVKINWVYNGEESYIEWFEPLPNSSPIPMLTSANTPFTLYKPEDVLLVEKQNMQGTYLIQVGIPHRVKNLLESRYCLSLVLSDLDNRRLSMSNAQLLLKSYLA
jgi:hypothetical protein